MLIRLNIINIVCILFLVIHRVNSANLKISNLKLSWKALGPGQLAKSEFGYYLTYRNIDPESRVVRWYAKFEPRSSHSWKEEKWSQSQFFFSLEDAQLFCEEHAEDIGQ